MDRPDDIRSLIRPSSSTQTANSKASTTITLYFTEDQIKALETASNTSRTSFSIYQVNSTDIALANGSNTTRVAATYTAIAGVGGSFAATVSSKWGRSFYRLGVPVTTKGGGPKNQAFPVGADKDLMLSLTCPSGSVMFIRILLCRMPL